MSASIDIDRTSLSLGALTVSDSSDTYRLARGGFGRPAITWRTTNAPDSDNVHGSELITAVKEQTSIPLTVLILGDTWDEVEAAIDVLDEALSQFSYPVTQTVGGVARVWAASPASWASTDPIESWNVAECIEVLNVTIPVQPIPGEAES